MDFNKEKASEIFKEIQAKKRLADDIYNGRNDLGFTFIKDNASAIDNLKANLKSTALKAKSLDRLIEQLSFDEKNAQKKLGIKPNEKRNLEPEEMTSSEINKEKKSIKDGTFVENRCKICNRVVKSGGVAGMGPKCASILLSWIENNDLTKAVASTKVFRKMSEFSDGELYPIMIIKEVKTDRYFPADIIKRESDGRYLVVDLSSLGKNSLSNYLGNNHVDAQNSMKEAFRVYLDEDEHEVAQVFGDKKK